MSFVQDDKIIDLLWDRKEDAINALADKYGNYCFSVAYNILHDKEDSKECVNDTYFSAWNSIPPHKPNCLSTYLGKITRNRAINKRKYYSAEKRGAGNAEIVMSELSECIPSRDSVEDIVETEELTKSINKFLTLQSTYKRNIFVKRYWYVCSIRQIADDLDVTEGKIASILFRMRNELRKHLAKEGFVL